MACCVRGYHEYKDIEAAATREVLVCGRWRDIVEKIFVVKLSCVRVRYFRTFSVHENIFATKKKANYSIRVSMQCTFSNVVMQLKYGME